MEFRDRFRAALRASGLTIHEAAQKIGVSPATISAWKYGAEPRLPQYRRIVDVFPELRSEFDAQPTSGESR